MKKIVSFFVAFVLVVCAVCGDFSSMTAKAATSGVTGDCTWTLDGTVLTISGEGKMADYQYGEIPWGTKITEVIIENGVTSIGDYAFCNCISLSSIIIPESVTSIGYAAFRNCWTSLTSITIPESVMSIGSEAFSACTSLTSITIPEGVTSIEESTFSTCSLLTSITIPESVTSIESNAFYGCSSLTSITIPESVRSIGAWAFSYCSMLTSIAIPESVTSIEDGAFHGCSSLTSITIPESVRSIGAWAFESCYSLTSITIPESVTSIGERTFSYCSSLTNIIIPQNVTNIDRAVFENCSSLTNIIIPKNVTSIEGSAFSCCSSLTGITIPENVTSIEWGAFEGCSSLTSITIPQNVTSIAYRTFLNCSSLASITIPEGVTSIGSETFKGCSSLTSVWFTGSQVDRDEMAIDGDNEELLKATWHYNACANNAHIYLSNCDVSCQNCEWSREVDNAHVYLADCDVSCQNCDWTREVDDEHIFALNGGYTCEECGHSKQPVVPKIESKTNSSVTLVHIPGCEYSKDGENWQDSNVFTNLSIPSGSSTYTFYQRIKATEQAQVSEKSEGLVVSFPAGGITGDCTWTLDGTVLTISGEGKMADYLYDYSPWGTKITEVIIENGVTSIGAYAFENCSLLTNITIPQSVTDIREGAFYNCGKLTSITIPEGVTSIGFEAFYGCRLLTSITLPKGVTSIESYAFDGCSALTTVWFTGSQVDRDEMFISDSNGKLLKANWHYNTCTNNAHVYLADCDISCQNCDWTREVDNDHIFAMNAGYTCQGCGYSTQPVVPQIESKTNSSVTLVHIPGCEYSKDGEFWQDSNVFTDLPLLSGSSTYTFYQRIKATEKVQVSEKSEGLVVSFKTAQSTPLAPTISSCTETSVTLVEITNGEYSMDGVNWQSSNVFDNLLSGTKYVFYQRYAETDVCEASNASVALTVTTKLPYILGDVNGDQYVTTDDAIQLLYYIMIGDSYLISQPCDFDGDGLLTSDDAIYLQYHIMLPEEYPLNY